MTMSGGVVFWPWAECVVALFIYISAIITKAKMTRIGGVELGEPPWHNTKFLYRIHGSPEFQVRSVNL